MEEVIESSLEIGSRVPGREVIAGGSFTALGSSEGGGGREDWAQVGK